jgi:hypothetical protein
LEAEVGLVLLKDGKVPTAEQLQRALSFVPTKESGAGLFGAAALAFVTTGAWQAAVAAAGLWIVAGLVDVVGRRRTARTPVVPDPNRPRGHLWDGKRD